MSDPSDFCIGCMNDEYPEGLRKEIESLRQQLVESQTKLIECQAREKVLRDALDWINSRFPDVSALVVIREALALPHDSTALDSAIKQAKREALLRAAESFTCKTYGLMPHDLRLMVEEIK